MTDSPPPAQSNQQPAPLPQPPAAPPEPPTVPVPTDFRRNAWLLAIIIGVVVLAWLIAILWRRMVEPARALQPPQGSTEPRSPRPARATRAEPVEVSRVIGSPAEAILAAPAVLLRPQGAKYRLERLFDVTRRAEGFNLAELLRRPDHWADGRPPLRPDLGEGPQFRPAREVDALDPDERVIVVETDGGVRGYPLALFRWRLAAQDVVGDQTVLVSWSSITQTARCLLAKLGGRDLTLGDAGLLYRGDNVLYDVQSGSLWDSFSGRALAGPMAGASAQMLPVSVQPWSAWRASCPDSLVADVRPGEAGLGPSRTERAEEVLEAYLATPDLPFDLVHFDPEATPLPPKAFVLGVYVGGEARAYPLGALAESGTEVLADTVGGRRVQVHVTSPRTAHATCDGESADAVVRLWFAWKEVHPKTSIYAVPASPSAQAPGEPS